MNKFENKILESYFQNCICNKMYIITLYYYLQMLLVLLLANVSLK